MDYYDRLGVSKNASQDELKKAYKKASMQHHPDRGGDEEQFKKINEAYATLKDPQKRAEYDNPQPQGFSQGFGPGGFQGMGGFEDIFSQFGFRQQRPQQRNQDININYSLSFKEMFTGTSVSIQYKLPSGDTEFLDAAIPPGVDHGSQVRFQNKGDNRFPNLPRGHLILRIKIQNDQVWRREGNNIIATKNINLLDFIIGTNLEIATPADKKFSLHVPANTKPGTTFSITGHGVPDFNTRRPGNVYIKLAPTMPDLTQEQMLKIKDIRNGTD